MATLGSGPDDSPPEIDEPSSIPSAPPRRGLAGRLSRNEAVIFLARLGLLSTARLASVLMALTILIAATAGYLQVNASINASDASRRAQQYSIQETAERVIGQARVSYDWHAYQTWYELYWQGQAHTRDNPRYDLLLETRRPLLDSSELLNEYYFPNPPNRPKMGEFEADKYIVGATETAERQAIAALQKRAWGEKATGYVTQLTFIAVGLFLFGLVTTIPNVMKWAFLIGGVVVIGIATFWMAEVYLRPVPERSQEAIQEFARAHGLYYQARDQEAVEAFSKVIEMEPGYTLAYRRRATALFEIARSLAPSNKEAALAKHREAVADLETLIGQIDADPGLKESARWSLGWNHYLLGNFDKAIEINRQILREGQRPNLFAVRTNLALALLAKGEIEEAESEFNQALQSFTDVVAETVRSGNFVSSNLWSLIGEVASDTEDLFYALNETPEAWTSAPYRSSIEAQLDASNSSTDIEDILSSAAALYIKTRGTEMALLRQHRERNPNPPGGFGLVSQPDVYVELVDAGTPVLSSTGALIDLEPLPDYSGDFPRLTSAVGLALIFDAPLSESGDVVYRVYRDDSERYELRKATTWRAGATYDLVNLTFQTPDNTFVDGKYLVEIYFKDHLVGLTTFTVGRVR